MCHLRTYVKINYKYTLNYICACTSVYQSPNICKSSEQPSLVNSTWKKTTKMDRVGREFEFKVIKMWRRNRTIEKERKREWKQKQSFLLIHNIHVCVFELWSKIRYMNVSWCMFILFFSMSSNRCRTTSSRNSSCAFYASGWKPSPCTTGTFKLKTSPPLKRGKVGSHFLMRARQKGVSLLPLLSGVLFKKKPIWQKKIPHNYHRWPPLPLQLCTFSFSFYKLTN